MEELKNCPHCEITATMLKVLCWFNDWEPEVRYRCLNCLYLFDEKMKGIIHWDKPSKETVTQE